MKEIDQPILIPDENVSIENFSEETDLYPIVQASPIIINAYTEIVAMISSLAIAAYFNFGNSSLEEWEKIVFGAMLTTIVWVVATFVTPPDDEKTLQNFVKKINPGGPGWSKYSMTTGEPWVLPKGILLMVLGCIAVYSILIGVGQLIYGNPIGYMLIALSIISGLGLKQLWK